MKRFVKLFFRIFCICTVSLLMITGCSKDDVETPEEKNYVHISTLSADLAKGLLIAIGQAELSSEVKYDIDVYSYTYKTDFRGEEITASGLICVPISSGIQFPVLSFQHGTMVAHSEAPSVGYNEILNKSIELIAGFGYIVLMPDLIGFGSSSEFLHPYLVKKHHITAVTDMLTTIKDIPNGDLSGSGINDSLFLMGYSQGGWSTLSVLNHLEINNNHGWNIIATASGAGPYYLEAVKDFALASESYSNPFYMAYVFECFADEGLIEDNLSLYYNEPYATSIPTFFDGSMRGSEINAELTSITADLYNGDFLSDYPNGVYSNLHQALQDNSTNAWKTNTNLLLMHGNLDESIPVSVSDSIYREFQNLDCENVEYEVLNNMGHNTGAIPAMVASLEWFKSFRQ